MKKTIITLALAIALPAVEAWANISVNWESDADQAAGVYLVDNSTLLPVDSIIQFIYSSDGIIGSLNPASPLVPTGNDVLLETFHTVEEGIWSSVSGSYGSAIGEYVGGYLYQRIFAVQGSDIPTTGDYYVDGMLSAETTEAPDLIESSAFASSQTGALSVNTVIPAVPEPTTIALALFGIGFFAIRRFRKKS